MAIECAEEMRRLRAVPAWPARRANGAGGAASRSTAAAGDASDGFGNRTGAGSLTPEAANALLHTRLAPWVRDLKLVGLECAPDRTRLHMPYSRNVMRIGDSVCGRH